MQKEKLLLKNCANEPEIKDLSNFLVKMGCNIFWKTERCVEVVGITKPKPVKHKILFDRIEAGTYIIASILTGNNVVIKNINPKIIKFEN